MINDLAYFVIYLVIILPKIFKEKYIFLEIRKLVDKLKDTINILRLENKSLPFIDILKAIKKLPGRSNNYISNRGES